MSKETYSHRDVRMMLKGFMLGYKKCFKSAYDPQQVTLETALTKETGCLKTQLRDIIEGDHLLPGGFIENLLRLKVTSTYCDADDD